VVFVALRMDTKKTSIQHEAVAVAGIATVDGNNIHGDVLTGECMRFACCRATLLVCHLMTAFP